jgi:hypothetical protein
MGRREPGWRHGASQCFAMRVSAAARVLGSNGSGRRWRVLPVVDTLERPIVDVPSLVRPQLA